MTDTIETTCTALVNDISDALTPKQVEDFRKRLEEVPAADGLSDRYWGVLLRMSWQARGAPTLAQRVIDLHDGITKKPSPTRKDTPWQTK